MSSVELSNVTYRYSHGGVSDLSFLVPEGQVACLLGASGSGKTTVLKLIAGFLRPQAGDIRLGGKLIADARLSVPPQKRHIGLVFQHHALFPHLTVAQNILFGCKRSKPKQEEKLEALLADFDIVAYRDRFPHEISGGEQQRVALARAIASDPALLLMDEPFSSLDTSLRKMIREQCMKVIRERGLTALIVTHDEAEAAEMSGQIIRLIK